MIKQLNRSVYYLAISLITLTLVLAAPAAVLASGDEELTPTVIPTETPEVTPEITLTPTPVPDNGGSATYGGSPVYGGGVIESKGGEVIIDKMVKNPATGVFVDQLSPIDPKYRPLNIAVFKITVKNPSDSDVNTATVVDSLPEFVDYMSGPGEYDADSRRLSFTVDNLKAGESRDFEIKVRISHQSLLPEEKNVICPVNVVEAKIGDYSDQDQSQFCIEKEMVVPQVPEAGAPTFLITLLGSLFSTGLFLRKKAFKS